MDARMEGILGGLKRLEGTGDVFIHSGGTIIPMELKEGEKLRVDTGCLVAFDPTVSYDIEFVGGIKTALFGGEGLFFASMTGPGRVWIQTLPFSGAWRIASCARTKATAKTSSATSATRSARSAI
jgi:uncharacterized protein (AIM24 family)